MNNEIIAALQSELNQLKNDYNELRKMVLDIKRNHDIEIATLRAYNNSFQQFCKLNLFELESFEYPERITIHDITDDYAGDNISCMIRKPKNIEDKKIKCEVYAPIRTSDVDRFTFKLFFYDKDTVVQTIEVIRSGSLFISYGKQPINTLIPHSIKGLEQFKAKMQTYIDNFFTIQQ